MRWGRCQCYAVGGRLGGSVDGGEHIPDSDIIISSTGPALKIMPDITGFRAIVANVVDGEAAEISGLLRGEDHFTRLNASPDLTHAGCSNLVRHIDELPW